MKGLDNSLWHLFNESLSLSKGDLIVIKLETLVLYDICDQKSTHPLPVGILLSDYSLNNFCEKMYKVLIMNKIIHVKHSEILEKIE